MVAMSARESDYKAAAIQQWTADPCGAVVATGELGSAEYFDSLLAGRYKYAPWMEGALGYSGCRGLRVLDVGCGQGIDLARYARAGADVTGIDLTPRHVMLARQHLDAGGIDARVVQGDAESLPFEAGEFERVSSNGVLHHTPDMPAALREIRRVLKPGGEARIIVYNRNSLHYLLHEVIGRGVIRGRLLREFSMEAILSGDTEHSSIGARPLVRVYTPRRLRGMLIRAGFVDVTTAVRHFRPEDTFVTVRLARILPWLGDPAVLDRIGRIAGWYVIARARTEGPRLCAA
jgi:ubiquinone/menaquinone biosynthesis C-methylase UbiE